MRSDHVRSNVGVRAHGLPRLVGERPGLVEKVVPTSELAEVVQRSGGSQKIALAITELQVFAQPAGKLRHSNRMGLGVTVSSIERLGGQLEGLILQLGLALRVSNVSPDREDEPKKGWSHEIADVVGSLSKD